MENQNEPIPSGMTDEEIELLEQQRKAEAAAKIAPCMAAREQRQESADIVAEHDSVLADILYEMTISEFGEEE